MKKILVVLLIIALFAVSCSKKQNINDDLPPDDVPIISEQTEPSKDDENILQIEPEEEPIPESVFAEKSLTTGLPCSLEVRQLRPIALMYNNLKLSYPQNGISKADIVYECDAEGGITRLMAIFTDWKKLAELGTVRSAREYYVSLAQSHGAIYVHAGGSPTAYDKLINGHIDYVDGVNMNNLPKNTFYRDSQRIYNNGYEHSMMTSGDKIANAIDFLGYSTEVDDGFSSPFEFNEEFISPDGMTATSVKAKHSGYITTDFDYNEEENLYYKSSYGAPHIDGASNEQLSFTNVIILLLKESIVDEEGRLDIDLTSGGKGYYISGGKFLDIEWSRKSEDAPFEFKYGSEALKLNPGKTHITLFNAAQRQNIVIK